jgi:hypothetical protein
LDTAETSSIASTNKREEGTEGNPYQTRKQADKEYKFVTLIARKYVYQIKKASFRVGRTWLL